MKYLLVSAILALSVLGAAPASDPPKLVCTKTSASMDACCCVEKDGALVCTLTGEPVDSCCCEASR